MVFVCKNCLDEHDSREELLEHIESTIELYTILKDQMERETNPETQMKCSACGSTNLETKRFYVPEEPDAHYIICLACRFEERTD